mgnify:CR=1 FL=1
MHHYLTSTVRPGQEVKLTINFADALGAYTFDIGYDNNIFNYVSVDGGTANPGADKVGVIAVATNLACS